MASGIESLPIELFEPVLRLLSLTEISILQQCSKALYASLNPYIFSFPSSVNKLLQWGCLHGETWAIEKAVTYGADISVVDYFSIRTQTLYLALLRRQYNTFQYLLTSGAQIDAKGVSRSRRRAFRQRLFDPRDPKFIQLLLMHCSRNEISQYQSGVDRALPSSVQMRLDPKICQAWLDLGANPVDLGPKDARNLHSALAVAVLSGSVSLTKLLLSYKPDLGLLSHRLRQDLQTRNNLCPWNACPMLAAARHMATNGTTIMLDMLLDAGGDINASVTSLVRMRYIPHHIAKSFVKMCNMTVMLAYLLALDLKTDIALDPSQGVEYLLSKGFEAKPQFREGVVYSPLRMLQESWGGTKECLLNDTAFGLLKLTIKHGLARRAVYDFLLPSWHNLCPPRYSGYSVVLHPVSLLSPEIYSTAMARWQAILDLLLTDGNFDIGISREIDGLLFKFLMMIPGETFGYYYGVFGDASKQRANETHPTTIRVLLEKGAHIDGRLTESSYSEMLLERIYERYILYPHHDEFQTRRWRSFTSMLVQLGAKPFKPSREPDGQNCSCRRNYYLSFKEEVIDPDILLWHPRSSCLLSSS